MPLKLVYGLVLLIAFSSVEVAAQSKKNRLQPGKMYSAGEKIYAPRYGFSSTVPGGWNGTLPREMEIFLLMPDTITVGGEIFTFSNEKSSLPSIRESWEKGANLSETIKIKPAGEIKSDGDMISSEVVPEGPSVNQGYKGFVAARCNSYGPCITCLGIGPVQFYDQIKTAVESFMSNATFTEPSNVSIYVDFNWREFLSDKMLISLLGMESTSRSGTKENVFHLCSDGSFKGQIKKKGMMKEINPSYEGKQSGTWSTESIGETGVLKLTFKKLAPVELPIRIKDEQIFINDERYFAAESDECGKK